MAVAESFEVDSSVHIGFVIQEKNVVFATRSVVVYYHTAGDVTRFQTSVSFNVDGGRFGWMSLSLSYGRT